MARFNYFGTAIQGSCGTRSDSIKLRGEHHMCRYSNCPLRATVGKQTVPAALCNIFVRAKRPKSHFFYLFTRFRKTGQYILMFLNVSPPGASFIQSLNLMICLNFKHIGTSRAGQLQVSKSTIMHRRQECCSKTA